MLFVIQTLALFGALCEHAKRGAMASVRWTARNLRPKRVACVGLRERRIPLPCAGASLKRISRVIIDHTHRVFPCLVQGPH